MPGGWPQCKTAKNSSASSYRGACCSNAGNEFCQAGEAALPPVLMLFLSGHIGNALVNHHHFGSALSRLEAYSNYFRSMGLGFDLPAINQFLWRLHNAVLADNPKYISIGEKIPNSVSASDAQIHDRIDTFNPFGPP